MILGKEPRIEGDWLEAVVVVAFHVEHGQVIEDIYSLNASLSEAAKRKICSLSLPDSNSGQNGDVQFIFRFRNSTTPLHAGTPLEDEFFYCSAFFRQIKDKTLKRGYFQKSVVLVSKNPFTSFLEDCSYIIGPLFFEFGKSVIEAILQNIKSWPAPIPGQLFQLPIAGCFVSVSIPEVEQSNSLRILTEDFETAQLKDQPGSGVTFVQEQQAQMQVDSSETKLHSPRPHRQFVYESSGGGYILKKKELLVQRAARKLSATTSNSSLASPSSPSEDAALLDLQAFETMAKRHEQHEAQRRLDVLKEAGDFKDTDVLEKEEEEDEGYSSDAENSLEGGDAEVGGAMREDTAQGCAEGEEGGSGFSFAKILKDRPEQVPGLFQDVPLFSTFGGLSVALWHIWELAIGGDPILVLAPTPDRCSQAVLAIASLIAPITYCGDFRPYFTIYDSDFMEISRKHDELKGQNMPPCLLGVTNPYFLKSLEYWPNVISMGGPGPSTASLARSQTPPPKELSGTVATNVPVDKEATYRRILSSSTKKNRVMSPHMMSRTESVTVEGKDFKTAKYHPTIAKRGDSLRALLTDQKYERSIILTRDRPLVAPDKNLLKRLLSEHDAAKAGAMVGGVMSSHALAEHPVLAINNAALRHHFQHLTKTFLRPLEDFLKLESVGSRAARLAGLSVSAYEQPGLHMEKFNRDLFFEELERNLPPKELQRSNWRQLYAKFVDGPNFEPWFNKQREKLEMQLGYIYRHLRLSMDHDVLLQAAGATTHVRKMLLQSQVLGIESQGSTTTQEIAKGGVRHDLASSVYARIKRALDDELSKSDQERDEELVAKIREHLLVVQNLLALI